MAETFYPRGFAKPVSLIPGISAESVYHTVQAALLRTSELTAALYPSWLGPLHLLRKTFYQAQIHLLHGQAE